MAKQLLICLFLIFPFYSSAQTNEVLETYLSKALSYKTLTYSSVGKKVRLTIFDLEFNGKNMNYNINITTGSKIERYTVRIGLSGISEINIVKTKNGYDALTFTTKGKSIIKEYPDGNLIHQKSQFIPLTEADSKVLPYFRKLVEATKTNRISH